MKRLQTLSRTITRGAALAALLFGMGTAAAATVENSGDALLLASQASASVTLVPATVAGADATTPASAPAAGEARPHVSLPIPAAIWMFGSGLGALGLARRRLRLKRRNRPSNRDPEARHGERRRGTSGPLRQRIAHGAGGADGCGAPPPPDQPPDDPRRALLAQRFAELARALAEQPAVTPGRSFGMDCIKLGKRPFLALDEKQHAGIAFRVGEANAGHLLQELTGLDHWNPKGERQPKLSWLLCADGNGEILVRLAAAAYEQALKDAPAVNPAEGRREAERT